MNVARSRDRWRLCSLLVGGLLLLSVPLLSVHPAAGTCPTAPSGRYLGTWNYPPNLGGVGVINATITDTTINGTMELVTGTNVLLNGATITGSISCGHIVATAGGIAFVGDIAPSGTEMAGTFNYAGQTGTWRNGLVTDETTSTGTAASTPGGLSSIDPIGVSVSSPTPGPLTIQEAKSSGGAFFPYSLFDTVVRIDAPPASAQVPLELTFTLAAAATGGVPAASIVLFRDGVALTDCTGAPQAIPDPCVSSRVDLPNNGATLVVLTSHASTWNMGALPRATPTITWSDPADIVYGTALSPTQLNATASVPGSFVYTPVAGTVLPAGTHQALSVSFHPTDAANYAGATATAHINVKSLTFAIGQIRDGLPTVPAPFNDAKNQLTQALKPVLWSSGTELSASKGGGFFDAVKAAVAQLDKITSNDPNYQLAGRDKAELWRIADKVIVTVAVNKASGGAPNEWQTAKNELVKAENEWANDHDGPAFDHLKKAWQHAVKAMN